MSEDTNKEKYRQDVTKILLQTFRMNSSLQKMKKKKVKKSFVSEVFNGYVLNAHGVISCHVVVVKHSDQDV